MTLDLLASSGCMHLDHISGDYYSYNSMGACIVGMPHAAATIIIILANANLVVIHHLFSLSGPS